MQVVVAMTVWIQVTENKMKIFYKQCIVFAETDNSIHRLRMKIHNTVVLQQTESSNGSLVWVWDKQYVIPADPLWACPRLVYVCVYCGRPAYNLFILFSHLVPPTISSGSEAGLGCCCGRLAQLSPQVVSGKCCCFSKYSGIPFQNKYIFFLKLNNRIITDKIFHL